MNVRMNAALRTAGAIVAVAIAIVVVPQVVMQRVAAGNGVLTTSDGDTVDVTESARAAGLTYAATVTPVQREWIAAAIARARPEASRLIAEVDGLTTIGTYTEQGETLGITRGNERGFTVDFNFARLDGDRAMDRATVVLHELGHVIDFALVPKEVNAALDQQIPRGGPCGLAIDCELVEERFADTFAKWALRGAVAEIGAGYGIAMPSSIEDWGMPLANLGYQLPAS
jgi:hypothetical protein